MNILNILIGLVLLGFGRRLFWLFVAVIGFAVAWTLTTQYLDTASPWLTLGIALGAGLIGALLAIFLQEIAIGLAGFLAGGYLMIVAANQFNLSLGPNTWIPFILAGLIGMIFLLSIFDWALIILSSLSGAALVADNLGGQSLISFVAFALLLIIGISVQAGMMRRGAGRTVRRRTRRQAE